MPESGPVKLTHRGLALDEIEDLLLISGLSSGLPNPHSAPGGDQRASCDSLAWQPRRLCAVPGLLDGVFGSGEDRDIATWRSIKVTDCSEEVEEDGTIIRRERERFTNELTLLYASGKIANLR